MSGTQRFTVGQKVYYFSGTHKKYLIANITAINVDGTVDLDVRKGASISSIFANIPYGFHEVKKTMPDEVKLTGVLGEFGRDIMTLIKQKKVDPCIGRDEEIRSMMQVLARKVKNNPIVVGESGVGKTKLVYGLAQKIADGDVPFALKDKRIISVDVGTVVAGAGYKGQFEERIKDILKAISASNGKYILFLDDIHLALQGGKGEEGRGMNAADLIKPALQTGSVSIIGTSTFQDFKKTISKDPAFERRFQQIQLAEPSVEETVKILHGIRAHFEEHHAVSIADDALQAAANLSSRYIRGRYLPDKAIDCLDEACASVRMETGDSVETEHVARVISTWTKIPLEKLTTGEREKLLRLDEILSERVLGQDDAVRCVADAILRARACLNREHAPLGSFLFTGPSGVGKTELAKAIAGHLFDERNLIRLDMSEYMQPFSVSRLIGAPPGFAGYEEGGQLTEAVRKQPYTVVLFDEIEKAHATVFNLFLQVLDDGRLTDGQGRTIDFSNVIVVMTSNFGSQDIAAQLTAGVSEDTLSSARESCMSACKDFFRPEFINRLDALVFFKPLTKPLLGQIVEMQVKNMNECLAKKGVRLHVTPEAVKLMVDLSYLPEDGARPVRRFFEKHIGTALSRLLVANDLSNCEIWLVPAGEEEPISDECPLCFEMRTDEEIGA